MAASRAASMDLTEIAATTAEQIRASLACFPKGEPGRGSRCRSCYSDQIRQSQNGLRFVVADSFQSWRLLAGFPNSRCRNCWDQNS